jgi:prepilin-type N-terminal cleavage/methylation domain-containing protein
VSRQARCGFTLIELLIGLTLTSIVGGAVAAAVAVQWRSHDGLGESEGARQALRDGANVLLAELRAASPAGGDLVAVSDTALELQSAIGASVLCSLSVARDRIIVPPRQPAVGSSLTWWRDAPAPGDSVDILDGRGSAPDSLTRHEVVSIGGGQCALASGFVRSAADAAASIELRVSPALPPSIARGAPVRFLRAARYTLYRSSADGRWYLGIRERLGGVWSIVQPVAGPFAPAAASGRGGMAVVARDGAGAAIPTAPYHGARSLEISLRSRGTRPARALGRATAVAESLHVILAPRND